MNPSLTDLQQAGYHAECAACHAWRAGVAASHVRWVRVGSALVAALWLFALVGCQTDNVAPPASPTITAPISSATTDIANAAATAAEVRSARDSKLVASLEEIGIQIAKLPDSPEQIILEAEQTFSMQLLAGVTTTPEDRAAAAERVSMMEQGRTAEARRLYDQAAANAAELLAKIARADAERDAAIQRAREAIEEANRKLAAQAAQHSADMAAMNLKHAAELDAARQKVEAREKFWQTMIFSGLGALCLLGAAAMLGLKAYVPAFGAQAAVWLGAAGLALILVGVLVRAISRLIDDHPYLFWGGLMTAGSAVAITAGLIISNHYHAKDAAASTATATT